MESPRGLRYAKPTLRTSRRRGHRLIRRVGKGVRMHAVPTRRKSASCAGLTRASRLGEHICMLSEMAGTSPAMTTVGSARETTLGPSVAGVADRVLQRLDRLVERRDGVA